MIIALCIYFSISISIAINVQVSISKDGRYKLSKAIGKPMRLKRFGEFLWDAIFSPIELVKFMITGK